MQWSLEISTAPATEPITLADAKLHLRVTGSDEDTLITNLIVAARQWCENFQRRTYVTQTLKLYLDCFPFRTQIWLPRPPLQTVTSVVYTDTEGSDTTFATTHYNVDDKAEPGRIVLAYNDVWPTATLQTANGVTITYVAGYGDEASDVPQTVKQAMLLMIGHWYENRETVLVGSIGKQIEFAVESLLWQERVFVFSPGGES